MGTRKICVAVNKRTAHRDSPCVRLWGVVCGFLLPSKAIPIRVICTDVGANSQRGGRSRRKPRRFSAPGRPLLPAVRAVSRVSRWRFSDRPKMRLTLFSSRRAKRTVVCGFSLTLN